MDPVLPVVTEMIDAVNNGAIGEPTGIQGDLFALRDYDPDDRLFSPALGGGVTLDLGVYASVSPFASLESPPRSSPVATTSPMRWIPTLRCC
ncbi:oxidoreductase [Cutibacterium acnes JCM 18909]|nr:oxidoreductase [Cutibacterium acnes JCM 18909]